LQDILAVEEEIGCNIAEHLRTRLCQDQPSGTHPETNSAIAYEANLRGRYYLNQRTAAGITRAVEHFQQALALDARYAVAAAGLADAYSLAVWYGFPSTEMLPKARAAALQAIELDNTLAEAHLALAQLHRTNWEWAAEERAQQQALSLGANSARVHHSAAYFFAVRGRLDEALAEINRARELDPLNLAINADVAHILYYARRYDEAITQCQRTLELDARFESALTHQMLAELQKGQYQTVITNAQAAIQRGELREFLLASAYAASGQPAESSRLLAALRQRATREPLPPTLFTHAYASLGDKDSAFAWLEKAYQQRDAALLSLKVEPLLDPLRADPRFAALVRRVGLEP
jgi:tetratricopeptide (TPR) repeat protein